MADSQLSETPIIRLPDDEEMQARLRHKLAEYKERIEPYRAPELQQDTYFKIQVLERLLERGEVNTYNLSLELAARLGKREFSVDDFNNACAVIQDYATTGGANTFAANSGQPRPLPNLP